MSFFYPMADEQFDYIGDRLKDCSIYVELIEQALDANKTEDIKFYCRSLKKIFEDINQNITY